MFDKNSSIPAPPRRGIPLRIRLSLGSALRLSLAITAFGFIAYQQAKRTALDSLVHAPQDERIQIYGDIALYTTLLTLSGRYSGEAQQGQFRALVVWVRRDGRWQQLASQMTPIVAP